MKKEETKLIQQCMKQSSSHNWLVHRIVLSELFHAARKYCRGRLIDIGCSIKPWKPLFEPFVSEYIGLDHPASFHSKTQVDIFATAYETGLADSTFDIAICTAVLEHLERPQDAIREMYRILKPGGYVILTAPLFWHLHEEPRDFYRYTKYGLEYLFTREGFLVKEILPLSGFIVTFLQELCYFLERFRRRPIGWFISGMQFTLQWVAWHLRRWDKSDAFTWMYLVVAQKQNHSNETLDVLQE